MPRWSGWSRFGFPGNVRQLENICHWLTVMAPAQVIEPKDLPPEVALGPERAAAARSWLLATLQPAPAGAASASPGSASGAPGMRPVGRMTGKVGLEAEAHGSAGLSGRADVWDELTTPLRAQAHPDGLDSTKGRRIEAAHKLGIGRNTITRKIQELGLE